MTAAKEFVSYARQHPGELNYGSPSIGGPYRVGSGAGLS
jgi:tripartite-type tricarboxylate transporter receptor subunit TctC